MTEPTLPSPVISASTLVESNIGVFAALYTLDQLKNYGKACRDAAQEQEPVAWRTYIGQGYYIIDPTFEEAQKNYPDREHQPLYTTPLATPDIAELTLARDALHANRHAREDVISELKDEVENLKAERDALMAAAKLAMAALEQTILVPCYGGHPRQEAAHAALKKAGVK